MELAAAGRHPVAVAAGRAPQVQVEMLLALQEPLLALLTEERGQTVLGSVRPLLARHLGAGPAALPSVAWAQAVTGRLPIRFLIERQVNACKDH
jgi:hypothetical protein